LNDKQRVIERRFGLTEGMLTLQQLASQLTLTRERIRQIQLEALAELGASCAARLSKTCCSRRRRGTPGPGDQRTSSVMVGGLRFKRPSPSSLMAWRNRCSS